MPSNICFYWEPLDPTRLMPPPITFNPFFNIPKEYQQSFARYIEENPPRFKPQHYKGEDGYGNYHYLKLNGDWIDPDSKAEVLGSFADPADPSQQRTRLPQPYAMPQPPHLPIGLSGPRIMELDEEDEFYKGFVQECVEGDDHEDDPRNLRISPSTFARWAVGAAKGDSYVETVFLTQVCSRSVLIRQQLIGI